MDYKLFDDYITLQALLKELGIIQSGGAIKGYLAETTVLFNDEEEKRRGKKIRIGDVVSIPQEKIIITLVLPTATEMAEHSEELAEKERVATIVKKLNQENKKSQMQNKGKQKNNNNIKTGKNSIKSDKRKPVRFPGT